MAHYEIRALECAGFLLSRLMSVGQYWTFDEVFHLCRWKGLSIHAKQRHRNSIEVLMPSAGMKSQLQSDTKWSTTPFQTAASESAESHEPCCTTQSQPATFG
jgi:hypothetical protein